MAESKLFKPKRARMPLPLGRSPSDFMDTPAETFVNTQRVHKFRWEDDKDWDTKAPDRSKK